MSSHSSSWNQKKLLMNLCQSVKYTRTLPSYEKRKFFHSISIHFVRIRDNWKKKKTQTIHSNDVMKTIHHWQKEQILNSCMNSKSSEWFQVFANKMEATTVAVNESVNNNKGEAKPLRLILKACWRWNVVVEMETKNVYTSKFFLLYRIALFVVVVVVVDMIRNPTKKKLSAYIGMNYTFDWVNISK